MSSHHYSILVGYSLTWADMYINPIQILILGLLKLFLFDEDRFYKNIEAKIREF